MICDNETVISNKNKVNKKMQQVFGHFKKKLYFCNLKFQNF